jgi:hypothetical protein
MQLGEFCNPEAETADYTCVSAIPPASVAYGGACSATAQCADASYEPQAFDQVAVRCLQAACRCSVTEDRVNEGSVTYCVWGDWRHA